MYRDYIFFEAHVLCYPRRQPTKGLTMFGVDCKGTGFRTWATALQSDALSLCQLVSSPYVGYLSRGGCPRPLYLVVDAESGRSSGADTFRGRLCSFFSTPGWPATWPSQLARPARPFWRIIRVSQQPSLWVNWSERISRGDLCTIVTNWRLASVHRVCISQKFTSRIKKKCEICRFKIALFADF